MMVQRSLDTIRRIVVHHSAGPRSQSFESIERYHTGPEPQGRGWLAIGYHWVVLGDGSVRCGRPANLVGAHAYGHNVDSVGICVVGHNGRPGEEWSEVQVHALRQLMTTLRGLWPAALVLGHRDVGATVCPGTDVAQLISQQ